MYYKIPHGVMSYDVMKVECGFLSETTATSTILSQCLPTHVTDETIDERQNQSQRFSNLSIRPVSPLMHSRLQPIPHIPLHLLNSYPASPLQARCYSSDSQRSSDEEPHQSTTDTALPEVEIISESTAEPSSPGLSRSPDEPRQSASEDVDPARSDTPSGFASAFGFQSLKDLFSQKPPQNRYSRAREPGNSETSSISQPNETDALREPTDQWSESTRSVHHFAPSVGSSTRVPADGFDSFDLSQPLRQAARSRESMRTEEDSPVGRNEVNPRKPLISYIKRFESKGNLTKLHIQPANMQESSSSTDTNRRRPWGLPEEDLRSNEALANRPGYNRQQETQQKATIRFTSRRPEQASPPAKASKKSPDSSPAKDQDKSPDSQTLTHVNKSGEARMVDVGTKAATKRVAIANACVHFSNPEPLRLIFENSNKKGDVLGVARVAGIMGAKRTSDLIPLCHPVSISKVEVDLKVLFGGAPPVFIRQPTSSNGAVEIEALVECTGPTGVEMEALTAVNVAAMTIFDMCKAVDRTILIKNAGVVYKSGGKSGLHVYRTWAEFRDEQFFVDRGIDIPDTSSKKLSTSGGIIAAKQQKGKAT